MTRAAAPARGLEHQADEIKQSFNDDFWLEDRGYYALALDGDKRPVDALTSNIGHLLWSGIADRDKAASCVHHLMGGDLFSGWGVRTMAATEGSYNPIGYHVGTVWPHDNSLIAWGLRCAGYRAESARICRAMLEAAQYFFGRLPETFAGYDRAVTDYPVEYPTACSPHAWATAAPLFLLRILLGLEARDGAIEQHAVLPEGIGSLALTRLPGRAVATSPAGTTFRRTVRSLGNASWVR